MTAEHDLERRLTGHFAAEAPARAPDWLLETALRTIDTTPQRHALIGGPRRFSRMNAYAKWATAAVLVVAVGAIGFAVLRPDGQDRQPAAVASASPSSTVPRATPQSSTASDPEPTQQLAEDFSQPFVYTLPTGAEFAHGPDYGPGYFEVRIPAMADAGTPAGLIVQAIGGGRSDPCSETSRAIELPAGPRAVLDYLKTISQLEVTEESVTAVGPNAAWQASVEWTGGTAECPQLWLWADSPESFPEGPLRLIALDAGGEHVVLTIFGEASAPGWNSMADELVGSIRFVESAGGRIAPPLNQSFTSTRHGVSLSYPEGWATQAATASWAGGDVLFREPQADFIYDRTLTDHLFIRVSSRPLGGESPNEWAAGSLDGFGCTATEPIDVDGAQGVSGAGGCNVAAVALNGRGYLIALYTSGDEDWLAEVYDRAWFESVLATVQLHPEDAVD